MSERAEPGRRRRRDRDAVKVIADPVRVFFWTGGGAGKGKRKYERYATIEEAEARAAGLRAQFAAGRGPAPRADVTVAEMAAAFIDHLRATNQPTGTIAVYRSKLNCWVLPIIGEDTVAMSGLHSWVACIDACYRSGNSRNTIVALVRMMAALGGFGVTHGYWSEESEPWGSAKRRRDTLRAYKWADDTEDDRGITLDEVPSWRDVEKLAAAMEEHTGLWRCGAAVIVAVATGARQCELLALRVEDVDLDGGSVRIERQVDRYQQWPAMAAPKRNKKRTTIFWAHIRPVVERLVNEADEGWLFAPPAKLTRWADYYGHRLDEAAKAAGFEWPGHYLRHHFASVSLAPRDAGGYGLDVADVSRWLGHSSSRTTMDTYRQPQRGSAAAAQLATSRPPT